MKFKGIIPELKMIYGTQGSIYYLKKMKKYPVLSINTSSLFHGSLIDLKIARKMYPNKYLIRKDFIMIPRQIEESKEAGADAVLILADFLCYSQFNDLLRACKKYKIQPIVETCYSGGEIPKECTILVNSRNLNDGKIDKKRAKDICGFYKHNKYNVIYASGEKDDRMVKKKIVDAVLIGTEWMKAHNVAG